MKELISYKTGRTPENVYFIKLSTGNVPKQTGNLGISRFQLRKCASCLGATGPQMIQMARKHGFIR
jgi:hypothetical protein